MSATPINLQQAVSVFVPMADSKQLSLLLPQDADDHPQFARIILGFIARNRGGRRG